MNINNNPFKILNVKFDDNRHTIAAAAEDAEFMLGEEVVAEAQNAILNPTKRLTAELDWFPGCDEEQICALSQGIDRLEELSTEGLQGLALLNVLEYNLNQASDLDAYDLGAFTMELSDAYAEIDLTELVRFLNESRKKAGLIEVAAQNVSFELNRKKNEIKGTLSAKMQKLSFDEYVKISTKLAEYLLDDDDDSIEVISDLIDQYEIFTLDELNQKTAEIETEIEAIKKLLDETQISQRTHSLVKRIKKWDEIAQPIQLKAQKTGIPHTTSNTLADSARGLYLWLHNSQQLSELALEFIKEMIDVFAELINVSDTLDKDANTLEDMIKDNAINGPVYDEIMDFNNFVDKIGRFPSKKDAMSLINMAIKISKSIKDSELPYAEKNKLRNYVCMVVRGIAVDLHNEGKKTDLASTIMFGLYNEFQDIPSLKRQLEEEKNTLQEQADILRNRRIWKIMKWVAIGVAILIFVMSSMNDGSTSSSSSSSGSSSTSSSSSSSEVRYSSSAQSGDKVYVDITSIFPEIGIYNEGSSNYKAFVCRCETSSGSTVWVYMTCSEYKNAFDSSASTSLNSSYAEKTFSPSKRVHGTVKKADSVISDLSEDTGSTYVINFSSVGK